MFVVTVRFTTRPADHAAFMALITHNAAQSLAREPGCRQFDVCTARDSPGEVFLYELYDNPAAFETHKTMAHFLDFDEASAPLVTARLVHFYRLEPAAKP